VLGKTYTSNGYTVFPAVELVPGKHSPVPTPKRVWVPTYDRTLTNANGSMHPRRYQVPLILAW
jgi:hypothetical protein